MNKMITCDILCIAMDLVVCIYICICICICLYLCAVFLCCYRGACLHTEPWIPCASCGKEISQRDAVQWSGWLSREQWSWFSELWRRRRRRVTCVHHYRRLLALKHTHAKPPIILILTCREFSSDTSPFCIIIIIFKPTSTKPQAGKLG